MNRYTVLAAGSYVRATALTDARASVASKEAAGEAVEILQENSKGSLWTVYRSPTLNGGVL